MIVTELSAAGRSRTRVRIDDGWTMVLSNRDLVRYGIRLQEELSESVYEELRAELYRGALRKCGELLKNMDYTEKCLREKLVQKGYPQEIAESAVEAMKRAHYVDDARYARHYVQSRIAGRSLRRIRAELMSKGISGELADEAFAAWEEENGTAPAAREAEQIRVFLEKKHYDPEKADWKERQKLAASLMRRGSSAEGIQEALRP